MAVAVDETLEFSRPFEEVVTGVSRIEFTTHPARFRRRYCGGGGRGWYYCNAAAALLFLFLKKGIFFSITSGSLLVEKLLNHLQPWREMKGKKVSFVEEFIGWGSCGTSALRN